MGVLDRLRGLFRASPALPEGLTLKDGVVVSSSMGGRGAARRGTRELIVAYREQPWLRAVTSRIARGVASAGWCIYARAVEPTSARVGSRSRGGPNGTYRDVTTPPAWQWGRERGVRDVALASPDYERRARRRRELAETGHLRELPDHPALEVLAAPNPHMTGRAALQVTQIWLDIKGEAFWLLSFGTDGLPNGFLPLPPHWVTQTPTESQPYFRVSFGAVQLEVSPKAMIWFRDPDPENPYGRGTGVAESLGDELETDEFAAKYLKGWFFNNAMPSFIVSFEGAQAAEVTRAKEVWESEHRGYWNAHRAHFSTGKMNAVRLDASFRDQQIIDLRKLSRDNIVQVFAVPPELVGIIENSNRSTIDAARYIYALGVEWPRCEFLRAELQMQFLSRWDSALVLECEVSVPTDEDRRAGVMKSMPGAFSLNEWRGEAGYAPLPEFDGVFPPLAQPGQVPTSDGPETEADAEDDADAAELESPAVEGAEEGRALKGDPPWAQQSLPVR